MGAGFAAKLIAWQKRNGRHDLPWQATRDPYAIWVAEIMLQQTQVATVVPYYERFLARFPDLAALAAADLDEVLRLWSGLGYYSRARNLHRAARLIAREHGGRFPSELETVAALPGVGRSTAAAILVFSRGARHAILDGNVKRVLARAFGVAGYPGERRVAERLWRLAEALLPRRGIEAYTQGLMDLGATLCTRRAPRCEACPVRERCVAHARGWTERIPAPRPRRRLPLRRTVMLVLARAGEVLLEKRPPAGLWGGLWSLPEVERAADLAEHCLRRFGARIGTVRELPALAHGFTHYRLDIRPLWIEVASWNPRAAEPALAWLPLARAPEAALPAPVKRILAGVAARAC
jgi:A/G-specific adenine glycosylase